LEIQYLFMNAKNILQRITFNSMACAALLGMALALGGCYVEPVAVVAPAPAVVVGPEVVLPPPVVFVGPRYYYRR
jgi:hypothetical protein